MSACDDVRYHTAAFLKDRSEESSARDYIASQVIRWFQGLEYYFALHDKHLDCQVDGASIRLSNESEIFELFKWVHPNHERQGYSTEAGRILTHFGFTTLYAAEIRAAE